MQSADELPRESSARSFTSSRSLKLEEGVPLLPKNEPKAQEKSDEPDEPTFSRSNFRKVTRRMYGAAAAAEDFNTAHNDKVLFYDHDSLLTARTLLHLGKSAFAQKPVLYTLAYCFTLAALAASIVFFVPRASKFDTERFESIANFLKVFISFMLGIYVMQAFKRWWGSVTAFEKFLIAIRQMIFMLHTIRCTPEWRKEVEMYCVASGYILNAELINSQVADEKKHIDMNGLFNWLVRKRFLTDEEVAQIAKGSKSILFKSRAVWSWIAELVSHPVVEEGEHVLAPMLVRTISLCQACVAEIENLKLNITMQTPFMYAQLLSILVHVNNTILALSCGLALGSSMNEIRRRSEQLAGERDTSRREISITGQLYEAIQTVGVQLTILLITPLLYVAFLHIAHILCYPFGDESHHLPTETFIARLHSELEQMAENREYFREKHEQWKEHQLRKKMPD